MSTTDDSSDPEWVADPPSEASQSPDLTFEYDDPEEPSTVTVYPEGTDAPRTTWISTDIAHAVDPTAMR